MNVKFIKSKDYKLVGELGRGSCGKTVKLYDEIIDETFVCKKYEPFYDEHKQELFLNFIREIKLLYLVNHKNVVRVFNYYIYPEKHTGYIIMEHIEGSDIESYLTDNPQNINDIFHQCVSGFLHLERCKVLHRDIRPMNILVSNDGELKVIDFGFGKHANTESDFDKSISLNWWCEKPIDFNLKKYDYGTEVYFVGKLFEKLIIEREIGTFKYPVLLSKMCNPDPSLRISSFSDVNAALNEYLFFEVEFTNYELEIYRRFSGMLNQVVTKIESGCKYHEDTGFIQKQLENYYRTVMLEENVASNAGVLRCFLNGDYYYSRSALFPVSEIKSFIELIRSCSIDKRNIIVTNLCTRMDAIERYTEAPVSFDDDIPF